MIRTLYCSASLAAALALVAAGASAQTTLTVRDAWSRPAAETGAAYFTIVNTGKAADRLLAAASPAAAHVELHETVHGASGMSTMGGGLSSASAMSGGSAMSGMMTMKRVDAVDVPAGGVVTFKPGSYHVMLIGLKKPLKTGDRLELHLRFEKAGTIDVSAPVR
jgi:copper(I)-binding protein